MKKLSHRSDEDAAAAPVLSLSLGESQVFALCPKEDSPTWHTVFCEVNDWRPDEKVPASWKRADCMNRVAGKVAFWLDHGDILLMTGDTQEHFMHKTWPRTRLDIPKWASMRRYSFLDFKPSAAIGLQEEPVRPIKQYKRRICITARVNKYHPGRREPRPIPCPLASPDEQGRRANVAVDRGAPVTGRGPPLSSSSCAFMGATGYPVATACGQASAAAAPYQVPLSESSSGSSPSPASIPPPEEEADRESASGTEGKATRRSLYRVPRCTSRALTVPANAKHIVLNV